MTADESSSHNESQKLPPLKLETAEANWEALAVHVEGFLEAWELADDPPDMSPHLPEMSGTFQRMVLIELIKVDLEYRYGSDGRKLSLEQYQSQFGDLVDPDGMPVDLIYEEYHVRRTAGETIDVNDCLARFPEQSEAIIRMFKLHSPTVSMSLTGQPLTRTFEPGERIDDFYLMSNLGSGAFGSVFLARQESMQRMVALKVSADKGAEAQTLAQLDHPNIVRVYDQTRLPDQNLRLLYMQFAAGGTLQAVVRAARNSDSKYGQIVADCVADALEATGVLSAQSVSLKDGMADRPWPQVVCQLGVELAHALHYAHGQGVLHRDVKPANVLLDANGTAKLADFNISFSSELQGSGPAAYFGGSLAYMSPEQLDASDPGHATQPTDLDGRADVFSLGVLLWELTHGRRPFDDEAVVGNWCETLAAMAALRRTGLPVPPASADPVQQRLLSVVRRCLAPDPGDRYQSGNELAQDLGLCLQPRVARLLQQSEHGLAGWALKWPAVAAICAAILPNALAAVFNYAYNDLAINKWLPDATDAFQKVQVTINSIAFPLAAVLCIWFALPLMKALRRAREAKVGAPNESARRRALRLGRFAALLGITEWVIAGLAYPISLHIITGGLDARWYAHFFGSLLICGMVAAAYPFFLLSVLAVRSFFPALLRGDALTASDEAELHELSEGSAWSLYLAGGVPAAGITLLLLTNDDMADANITFALTILSALGAAGFAFALCTARSLQNDIEAFQEAGRLTSHAEDSRSGR
ncbi:MAG: serine/threonine protein kinase [Fuerstiella sp.]|nr:serine/threonine protein kinase [Fuerstiella sp.]MCP4859415.1 serine/threonine protein kinase [Fuerstiella sp.]